MIHDRTAPGAAADTGGTAVADRRVQFDFEIEFSNGGGLRGQGFRLDIEGDDIADEVLADYLVRDMRLLMVGTVRIYSKMILAEAHKRPTRTAAPRRLVDVSHDVEDGMVTYRGLPAPVIRDHWTREESRRHFAPGTEFHIGRIDMVANTGTYVDSPFHRYAGGRDLAGLPLESLADLPGVVVRVAGQASRGIDVAALARVDVRGKAVLLHTGWDAHWRTERYFEGHPFLSAAGAEWLASHGAALVGIDSLNIDDTSDLRRSAHSRLLGADIPIVEHLCGLERVPEAGFRFFAVPVKVLGLGTFPVRAFAVI
jgi:kynurenine formamidase